MAEETKKTPMPTIESVEQDMASSIDDMSGATSKTDGLQTKMATAAEAISSLGANMSITDAKEIIKSAAMFGNKDTEAAGTERLDKYKKMYGPNFADEAESLLFKMKTIPARFGNRLIHGVASTMADAATINDATWTSPDQATLKSMSDSNKAEQKQLYGDRQKQLVAQAPQYAPLSNDPSMNQMLLGMAMQGAAGLLSLIDPEIGAAAAAEVGSKTIDAMYERKVRIDSINKDLHDKYIEAGMKHNARGDASWKTYYDSVMKENENLGTLMQKQIDDEAKNMLAGIKNKADILKQEVDALEKQGNLSKADADSKREMLKVKTDAQDKLLSQLQKKKNAANMMAWRWGVLAQEKINTGLQYTAPQFIVKDPRTIAYYGPNFDYAYGFSAKTPDDKNQFYSGMSDSATYMPPELSTAFKSIDTELRTLDRKSPTFAKDAQLLRERLATIVTGKKPENLVEMTPQNAPTYMPDEIRRQPEFYRRGFSSAVNGVASQMDQMILESIDAWQVQQNLGDKSERTKSEKVVSADLAARNKEISALYDKQKKGKPKLREYIKNTYGEDMLKMFDDGDLTIEGLVETIKEEN